jgi:hypothetical protein
MVFQGERLKWKLVSVRLDTVLILIQDSCTVLRRTYRKLKNHFGHTRWKLVGYVGHVESRFGPFGDSVSLGARQIHSLHQTYHSLRKSFWTHPMELLSDVGHIESPFGPFGDSVSFGA